MSVTVRRMRTQDTEAILRIDEKITGRPHEAQYESRIIDALTRNPLGCLVAEAEGKIVGFILGDIRGWEFAIPKCGWIEIVGVDPDIHGP
jgi:predicted N-acetyltransferase YhbS